jgi:ribosome-binding protein aMBF1 (putative translation factor)
MSSYLVRTSELDKREARPAMTNNVRERRTARGLSQGQLAAALAVSRQTINSIETGRYVPSPVEEMFHESDD